MDFGLGARTSGARKPAPLRTAMEDEWRGMVQASRHRRCPDSRVVGSVIGRSSGEDVGIPRRDRRGQTKIDVRDVRGS
jgi:hypothetical protein